MSGQRKLGEDSPSVEGTKESSVSEIYDVEESTRANCKPRSDEELRPDQTLLCTLDHFGPSMGVSFEFKIETFDMPGDGEWRGMLHFKEKNAKGWFGPVGSRVPAFYINVKTKTVRVFYAINNNGKDYVTTAPLAASSWHRIEFLQTYNSFFKMGSPYKWVSRTYVHRTLPRPLFSGQPLYNS